MKSKPFIVALVGMISVLVASSCIKSTSKTAEESAREKSRVTLRQRAQKAKEKGETRLESHGIVFNRAEFISLDNALNSFYLLEVELITKKSVLHDDSVRTWYKFRVLDTLSRAKNSYNYPLSEAPPELLPLQADEILVAESGGTVTVDGVEVSWGEPGQPGLRAYDERQKYLLFLLVDPASKIGTTDLGSTGVLVVSDDGTFTPFDDKRVHAYNAFRTHSINGVKEDLKHRR
jgi:hypothetical protein